MRPDTADQAIPRRRLRRPRGRGGAAPRLYRSLLILACSAALSAGCRVTKEFHESFPLAPGGGLILENATGGATITGWDRDEVQVTAVARGRSGESLRKADIRVEAAPNRIRLATVYTDPSAPPGSSLLHPRGPARVEYRILVPRGAELERIEAVGGDLRIEGLRGTVRARALDGSIVARFERLDARSATILLETVRGGIDLRLPSRPDIRLDAHASGGRIASDFGIPMRSAVPGGEILSDLNEILGTGRIRIRLQANGGDISILELPGTARE